MRRLGWLLLLPSCMSLELREIEQPIVGGELADPSEFPTIVALENAPGEWFCTGTLIHPEWVLTAAHCLEGENAPNVYIRFDDADINDTTGGFEVPVTAVIGHPGYDGIAWDNDIGLVKLAAPITDRVATPIHRAMLPAATMLTIAGYGDGDDRGRGGGILRKLDTPTLDCATTGDPDLSNDNVLCFDASDGAASCYGDSGGPAYLAIGGALFVAGVTSGGTRNSCVRGWDVYTAVAGELDFVDAHVPLAPPDPPTDPDPDPDPTDPTGTDPDDDAGSGGGCNAGHGGGLGLCLVGLALLRRRRAASVRRR